MEADSVLRQPAPPISRPGDIEEWREVVGFEFYDISSEGRLRSWRSRQGKGLLRIEPLILRPRLDDRGYLITALLHGGRQTQRHIHRLVGEAFIGPLPKGMVTRHWDGDSVNNRASNLRYGTAADNVADRTRHGTTARGEGARHKLTELQVFDIRRLYAGGAGSHAILARWFGVSADAVGAIVNRRTWAWLDEPSGEVA